MKTAYAGNIAAKYGAIRDHLTLQVIADCWQHHYGSYPAGSELVWGQINTIFKKARVSWTDCACRPAGTRATWVQPSTLDDPTPQNHRRT